MSKFLVVLLTLLATTAQGALPPTRSGTVSGNLSTQFNWIYKDNFLTSLGGVNKLVENDDIRLLQNQSFESPTAGENWTYVPSGADVMEAELVDKLDGARSLKITPAAESFTLTQTVSADQFAGSIIGIKGWVKADFPVNVCFMQGAIEGNCNTYSGSNEWREILAFGNVTSGTDIGLRFSSSGAVTGTAYFDFVRTETNPFPATDIYASSEWESYTPTNTQGFGTITDVNLKYRRNGGSLEVFGYFTTGTVFASEAQIELPNSYVISGSASTTDVGKAYRDDANVNNRYTVLATGGDTFVNFGKIEAASPLTTVTGFAMVGSGVRFSVRFSVPIAGWSDTAQGVVVKNRTDSASVENRFEFWVTNNGTFTISEESIAGTFGGSRSATGSTSITYTGLNLTKVPSVRCVSDDNGNINLEIKNVTTTGFDVRTYVASTDVDTDGNYHCAITKMAPDYIKETDKVYTVPVDTLTGNYVRAEGNGGTSVTASTTDIPFTEVTDTASAWDGDSYTVQKNNSVITLKSVVLFTSSADRAIDLYKNGTLYKRIGERVTNTGQTATYVSSRGEFVAGDSISLRVVVNGGTLSNSSADHYLNITEEYGDRGTFLGTFGQPTCYVKDVKSSGTAGGSSGATTYNIRTLNTTEGDCSFLSLSSNQFTLEAGSYNIECDAPAYKSGNSLLFIYDVDDTVYVLRGTNAYTQSTDDVITLAHVRGRITRNASDTFELRHYTQTAQASNGLGGSVSLGDEVYSTCAITKVR